MTCFVGSKQTTGTKLRIFQLVTFSSEVAAEEGYSLSMSQSLMVSRRAPVLVVAEVCAVLENHLKSLILHTFLKI